MEQTAPKKKKKRRKISIYALNLAGMVIIMVMSIGLAVAVGSFAFTSTFQNEYNSSAYRAAVTAETLISADKIPEYAKYTKADFDAALDEPDNEENSDKELSELVLSYKVTESDLQWLCDYQDMAVVYVIVPDSDYKHYTCIFNCLNKESTYSKWELGHVQATSSEDYEKAYRRLYNGDSDREMVVRTSNLNGGLPHVTALMPIKKTNGTVVGLMCVQRNLDSFADLRKNYIQGVAAITLVMLLGITLFVSIFIRKQVSEPLRDISKEAARFAFQNKRDKKFVGERLSCVYEVSSLANSLEKMEVDTIKNIEDITRITSERERIGAELSLASGIQNGMLPSHNQMLDDVEGFEIFATMDPAKEVGGDFYDFYMIDDTHLAMLIADVSDKGVGAAFFMAIAKTLIKARALMGGSPVEIITYADKLISEKNPEGMFVTVWLGIIDLETGHMDICNAGHDYPAVMKDNKKYVIEKTPHGPAVAFLPGVEFVETELDLKPGDRIFLYTDGLNEAKGMDGDRFGLDRMLSVLNIYNGLNDKELIAEMKKNVDKFTGDESQFDDMTMLSFTYKGLKKKDS